MFLSFYQTNLKIVYFYHKEKQKHQNCIVNLLFWNNFNNMVVQKLGNNMKNKQYLFTINEDLIEIIVYVCGVVNKKYKMVGS